MKRFGILLAVLLSVSRIVSAQGSLDAEKVYLWSGGSSRVNVSTGSGAPSGQTNGSLYVDYGSTPVELYIKVGGSWEKLPRTTAANTWSAANTYTSDITLSQAAPQIYFNETDQGSNLKLWTMNVNGQTFNLQTLNDAANTVLATALTVTRSTGGVTIPNTLAVTGASDLTGNATVHADVLPFTNYTSNAGSLSKKLLTVHAAELWVETLVAQSTLATIGGRILVAPTNTLTADRSAQLTVTAPTVTPQGVSGATTYSYKVSALDMDGESVPSSAGQTTTGNAALSVSNFNRITWPSVTGATLYAVYGRTSGSWLLIATTASATYDDTGALSPSGAPQATNGTARQFRTKYGFYAENDQPYMESSGKVEFLQTATWPISGVNTGAHTFTIGGDRTDVFTSARVFAIVSSTGNNGNYTLSTNSTYNIGTNLTTLTVTGTIPSAVADGGILVVATGADFIYFMTRDRDGSGSNQWYAGDAQLNTGITGKGFIDLYSTSGVLSGSGPSIVGNVRTSSTYNAIAPRWAIGNLNGTYGYVAETYGVAMGDASNTNITIDATNGFRIRSGTTDKLKADISGNLSLTGDLAMSTSGAFRAGASAFGTGTGWWLDYNSGTPRVRVGNPSGNYFQWDGSAFTLVASQLSISPTAVVITPNSGTGWATANGYTFTGGGTFGLGAAVDGSGNRFMQLSNAVGGVDRSFLLDLGAQALIRIDQPSATASSMILRAGSLTIDSAPSTATTVALVGTLTITSGGLVMGAPTGGDKGSGAINVAADIYKNNTAYTNPRWALQRYFTGTADHAGPYEVPAWYTGLRTLDEHRAFVSQHFDLPLMLEELDGGMFRRGDMLMASLEEAYLYIYQLSDRIAALERQVKK